jgi:hypothetical protein
MATIKISSAKSGTGSLEKYLKQEEKTEQLLMSGKDCDIENFAKDFQTTREIYEKKEGRQHYHIIQSFVPGEVSPGQAHEIGQKFANQKQFEGFQVAIVTHKDKEHIHNHIVVNAVNFETGKKYNSNAKSLYELRNVNDEICKQNQLSVIEHGKTQGQVVSYELEKYNALKQHFEGKAKSYIVETALAVEKSLEKSTSKNDFIERMSEHGYKTTWIEERKNITFENQEGKKVRLSNLEKTFSEPKYSREGLINEFERVEKTRGNETNVDWGAVERNVGSQENRLPKHIGTEVTGAIQQQVRGIEERTNRAVRTNEERDRASTSKTSSSNTRDIEHVQNNRNQQLEKPIDDKTRIKQYDERTNDEDRTAQERQRKSERNISRSFER